MLMESKDKDVTFLEIKGEVLPPAKYEPHNCLYRDLVSTLFGELIDLNNEETYNKYTELMNKIKLERLTCPDVK